MSTPDLVYTTLEGDMIHLPSVSVLQRPSHDVAWVKAWGSVVSIGLGSGEQADVEWQRLRTAWLAVADPQQLARERQS